MMCNTPEFWKRKLAAMLHDPPDKCFDIARHEENARSFQVAAGFNDEDERRCLLDVVKKADHFASAADRFVFPKGKCAVNFNGQAGSCFIHPLASRPYLTPENLSAQAGLLHDVLQAAVGGIKTDDWRQKFFLYWRRWLENSVSSDKSNARNLAFLPADSRLPDHSIWNHMSIVSALAGCTENDQIQPALLLFQLGPVQDFIAQARSTRDLWSGSYLLSWLIAHAMKAVTDQVGPDAVIFPSLRGNGIFDALHREEMYATLWADRNGRQASTWERLLEEKESAGKGRASRWLLTPTLPNRFLALVPAGRAAELAKLAESAIYAELGRISAAVWQWLETEARDQAKIAGVENWQARWNAQVKSFPQVTWAVQPWLDRDACLAEFAKLPVNQAAGVTPEKRLKDMLELAEKWLPQEDRDARYYSDHAKTRLNNPGVLWSAHYALVDAKLAARRNTRDFNAWTDPTKAEHGTPKDSLSGKEEVVGDEALWKHLNSQYPKLFKAASHHYGAMNLIKRLWCRDDFVPYLRERLGLQKGAFGQAMGFETVEGIANGNKLGGKYVAILAMDGDEMGKWVSGEKTPEFLHQVAANARQYLEPILKKQGKPDLHRLLTPSYHLQFSEALANFSTWLAEPIVEAFDGQLVYSGGDDVLAMLPADQAVACAETLRAVFRGEPPENESRFHFALPQDGFALENAGYPLVMPGPEADVSVGLAVGHANAPLQMLVREAQKAEKRAKKDYGRGALAVSLYKRSGEIIEWGCKWDDGDGRRALELMRRVTKWSSGDNAPLSGRFPYALAGLLAPYQLNQRPAILGDTLRQIMLKEFEHVLQQQGAGLNQEAKCELRKLAEVWLKQTAAKPADFAKLFLVETFINRHREEN